MSGGYTAPAGDLQSGDIGKRVKISFKDGTEITGRLASVKHEAAVIEETRIMDPEPVFALGQPYTHLEIVGVGMLPKLRGDHPVEVVSQ